jgi:hypothetical protein
MATSYHVFTTGDEAVATRARKDAAIKFGDNLMEPYRVVTDSGKVVHVVHETVVTEEQAPAEEPTVEAEATEEEDLIGDVPTEEPAEEAPVEDDEPEAKPGSASFDIAAMKRKIAGLLAKAEKTDNEHERDAFNAKAEKLMLRLGLNQAELEAAGEKKAEKIVEERLHWENVYAKTMVDFAHAVCGGIGNLTTLQSGRWANATVYIIGHKSDVELAVKLIRSLELQVLSALKAWQKASKAERAGQSNYDKLVGNRSFIKGFAATVNQRLHAERTEVEAEASTGAALVLASKMDRVMAALEDMYPKLGKARKSGHGRYSSVAAAAGREAGAKADIGNKRVGGKKAELA